MKIAIDVSPLESGHKVRGVGFYLNHLKDAFGKYFPEHEYIFFTSQVPSQGVDVIHYPYFDPFFNHPPYVGSIPTVVTVHDLTPIKFSRHFPAGMRGRLRWELNRRALARCSAVITDSDSSTHDVRRLIPINPEKVSTVYLAAGEEFKQVSFSSKKKTELMRKYGLPEKFALYVGDVTWNKNLPRLLKAAVTATIPLVLVGKAIEEKDFDRNNPWNKDRIEVQKFIAANKSLQPLGFVSSEDLVSLYNLATVFVMPSLYEGFGLPVIEAMQSGCPVITSKEGSLEEVAGDSAYYVDAYNAESIAQGLTEVFNSDLLQNQLSNKGLKRAQEFSWKKTASDTIEVYKKITDKNFI